MVMVVDMCHLWKLIRLDHGIIWTLFDFGFQPVGMHETWRWGDPHWGGEKAETHQTMLLQTPHILQEVLASGVQALEITSQLTVSCWHNKLFSILLGAGGGGEKYKEFWNFSCDNRPGRNNNVLKLNLSWCLGFQGLTWTSLGDSNFIITNIISI